MLFIESFFFFQLSVARLIFTETNKDVPSKSQIKKRKIHNDLNARRDKDKETTVSNKLPIAAEQSDTVATDQSAFKEPRIFHARKTFPGKMPFTIIPVESIPTARKSKPHVPIKIENSKLCAEPKPMPKYEPILFENKSNDSIDPNMEHPPDVLSICNAMVENNTLKMSNYIRSSLESTLFGFLDAAKPSQQIHALREQLINQRNDYESMIKGLRNQNVNITGKLNDLKEKYYICTNKNFEIVNQNDDLLKTIDALKMKNASLMAELEKVKTKNDDLTNTLNVDSKQNALLDATVYFK